MLPLFFLLLHGVRRVETAVSRSPKIITLTLRNRYKFNKNKSSEQITGIGGPIRSIRGRIRYRYASPHHHSSIYFLYLVPAGCGAVACDKTFLFAAALQRSNATTSINLPYLRSISMEPKDTAIIHVVRRRIHIWRGGD